MATISQVIASPAVYFRKFLSILNHQTWKLWGRIIGFRFLIMKLLSRTGTVDIGDGVSVNFVASSQRSVHRAKQILVKEPKTTEWVLGFEEGTLFWDIGANAGGYTLLAACRRNARVFSFEPLVATYHDLVMNIAANGLGDRVGAFCLAFTNDNRIDEFFVRESEAGYSGNSFGKPIDQYGNSYQHSSTYKVLGFSIDQFISIYNLDVPNHIKIDVDGIELEILRGATETFANPKLKSVLVELEESVEGRADEAIGLMQQAGLKVTEITTLIDRPNEKTSNYIFSR
jgi:FkbM family methyltransferase